MEFQPIESLAPYKDLLPQEDRASELSRFVIEWLTSELDRMQRLRVEAVHKGTMHDMGLCALGINSQLSSWIPRAERYRKQRKADIVDAVRERARADQVAGSKRWTEAMIKTRVDSELALWDGVVQMLKMVREDMNSYISFSQTSMRSMQTEEYSGNLQT